MQLVDRLAEIVMEHLHPGAHCLPYLFIHLGQVGPELPKQLGLVVPELFLVGLDLIDQSFQLCAAIFCGHESSIRPRAGGGTRVEGPELVPARIPASMPGSTGVGLFVPN